MKKVSTDGVKHVMDLSGGWSVYEITSMSALAKEISQMKYDEFWDEYNRGDMSYDEHVYSLHDANDRPCVPLRVCGKSVDAGGIHRLYPLPKEYMPAVQEFITKKKFGFYPSALRYTGFIYVNDAFYCLNNLPEKMIIEGDLDLSGYGLEELPDLSKWVIRGRFNCSNNKLTSLKGAPQIVGSSFICSNNKLTSLKGAPSKIAGSFDCSNNKLTSLDGGPQRITGGYYCSKNELETLKGAPDRCVYFDCSKNKGLQSLAYAPTKFLKFVCDKSLGNMPKSTSFASFIKSEALLRGDVYTGVIKAAKQIDKHYVLHKAKSKALRMKEKTEEAFYSFVDYVRS